MTVHVSAIKFLDFLAPPPILFPRPTLAHRDASRQGAASHGICTPHTHARTAPLASPRLASPRLAATSITPASITPDPAAALGSHQRLAAHANRRSISSLAIPVSRPRLCAQYHMLPPVPWLPCPPRSCPCSKHAISIAPLCHPRLAMRHRPACRPRVVRLATTPAPCRRCGLLADRRRRCNGVARHGAPCA